MKEVLVRSVDYSWEIQKLDLGGLQCFEEV